jgi:hypothetical protein
MFGCPDIVESTVDFVTLALQEVYVFRGYGGCIVGSAKSSFPCGCSKWIMVDQTLGLWLVSRLFLTVQTQITKNITEGGYDDSGKTGKVRTVQFTMRYVSLGDVDSSFWFVTSTRSWL